MSIVRKRNIHLDSLHAEAERQCKRDDRVAERKRQVIIQWLILAAFFVVGIGIITFASCASRPDIDVEASAAFMSDLAKWTEQRNIAVPGMEVYR